MKAKAMGGFQAPMAFLFCPITGRRIETKKAMDEKIHSLFLSQENQT
jgi:hypothetical protein